MASLMERDLRGVAGPTDEDMVLRAIRTFDERGFHGSFTILRGAKARCETCRDVSEAREVKLVAAERVDVATDPSDQQFVAALVCPRCGAKGKAILSYGVGGSAEDAEAMAAFRDVRERPAVEGVEVSG